MATKRTVGITSDSTNGKTQTTNITYVNPEASDAQIYSGLITKFFNGLSTNSFAQATVTDARTLNVN